MDFDSGVAASERVALAAFQSGVFLDENRLVLEWISASEGKQFAELINDFTKSIQELGPADYQKKLAYV